MTASDVTTLQYRSERITAADMITTEQAALLTATSRVTINEWIKAGKCIALSNLRRGYKLPRWQFEPYIWSHIPAIAKSLATNDAWQILIFLEAGLPALAGRTPRIALEQGVPIERILPLAVAHAH